MPLSHNDAVASLLDGPPLSSFTPEDLAAEVTDLLGDDDPLAVALVIEEATARADEHERQVAIVEAELEPCRLDTPCAGQYPVSGTGRCMECGAQRRKIEPETSDVGQRSDTEAVRSPESKPKAPAAIMTPEASEPSAEPPAWQLGPLTARVKEALGLPDKDMAHLLGVARPTAQAYASGRLPEIIDGVRAEYMLRAVRKRLAELEALRVELSMLTD
jgi:hypothetical protein